MKIQVGDIVRLDCESIVTITDYDAAINAYVSSQGLFCSNGTSIHHQGITVIKILHRPKYTP